MTNAQKLANDTRIAEFMDEVPTLTIRYDSLATIDRVVDYIQALGYDYISSSVRTTVAEATVNLYVSTFVRKTKPYGNVQFYNGAKSRFDATYKCILKFIDEYEPEQETTD